MYYKTKKWLKSIIFSLVWITILPVQAKDVYGFMTGNGSSGEIPIGMYKFDDSKLKPKLLTSMMYQFWGGAYVGNQYLMILSDDASGYLTEGLCKYDIDSNQLTLRYAQQPYLCTDLTYDYSTSTLYGVMVKNTGEDVKPRLIKINTTTGNYTRVADLSQKIVALAATYYGELYAMGDNGSLYEMNKTTGELTLIGNTGVKAKSTESQSMEFDRATGELYWSGLDENDNTFYNQIDPQSGKVIKTSRLADNALIVGLHIPFKMAEDGAPAKPQNLSATVGKQGVTLTWVNPTTLYGSNDTASQITKVEIWKNGQLLHTMERQQPGAEATYTDSSAAGVNGQVRYLVYAYNGKGRGEGAFVKVMAGEDIPASVTALTVRKTNEGVNLSWSAPTTGKNGGSVNPENLVYTVTRQPDGKTFSNLKKTTFTDTTIEKACYYYWTVSCKNSVGESEKAQTEKLLAGQALSIPFTANFENTAGQAQWKVVDHNADGNTWTIGSDGYIYNTSYTYAADDSLVSVPVYLEKGTRYVVKYDIKAPEVFSSEHFRLSIRGYWGEQILEDLEDFTTPDFSLPETRKVAFSVAESGDYQFILAALSKAGQFMIQVSAFNVEKENSIDLKADSLTTSQQLNKDKEALFNVKITNNGAKPVENYVVKLIDNQENELAEVQIDPSLSVGKDTTVNLTYTPSSTGLLTVKALVKAEGDSNMENDTVASSFYVFDTDEKLVELGGKDYLTDYPFWFSGYEYSYAQTIYTKEEINSQEGTITEIDYDYVNQGESLTDKHLKVYLGNTMRNSVKEGWMDETGMTLVSDSTVTFLAGEHTLRLRLRTPFYYTGGNLCVMTQKLDGEKSDKVSFYAKEENEIRTAIYNGNDAVVNIATIQGAKRLNHAWLVMNPLIGNDIQETSMVESLSLYQSSNNMVYTSNSIPAHFVVTDICGRKVASWNDTEKISLCYLTPGIYVVKADAYGQQAILKVMVKKQ